MGFLATPENQAGPLPRVGLYAHIIPSGTYQISGPAEALRVNFRTAAARAPFWSVSDCQYIINSLILVRIWRIEAA